MPRIIFTHDYDWAPPEFNGRWLVAYKAGWSGLVTTPCAAAAIAAGKARKLGETEKSGGGATEAGGDSAGGTLSSEAGARAKR